jgi:hypothetical protein
MGRKNKNRTPRKGISQVPKEKVAPARDVPLREWLDAAGVRANLRGGGRVTVHRDPDFASPALVVIQREEELERLVKVLEVTLPRACRIGRDSVKVPPRFTDRDREVRRLRDGEHLPWKEVLQTIRRNPAWANGQNGKPITAAALKAAYRRHARRRS